MDNVNDRHEEDFASEDTKKWFPKPAKTEDVETDTGPKFRAFLYQKDHPRGIIFNSEADFKKGLLDGWVEAPWLINEDTEKLKKQAKEKKENEEREKKLQEEYEEKKLQEGFELREKQRKEAEKAQEKKDKKPKKDKLKSK